MVAKRSRKNPLMFKITKKTKDIRCPKCKEGCSIDASGWVELPVGFGSRGGKFVVDKVRYTGWYGDCPKHGRIFAYHSKKLITKIPRGINRKLKALRGKG